MNLIEELGLEKCQAIVEGAPDWAKWWCVDKGKFLDFIPCPKCVDVNNLRAAIANHDLSVSNPNQNDKQIDLSIKRDIEDHCTDIRNHISPLTGVIER